MSLEKKTGSMYFVEDEEGTLVCSHMIIVFIVAVMLVKRTNLPQVQLYHIGWLIRVVPRVLHGLETSK